MVLRQPWDVGMWKLALAAAALMFAAPVAAQTDLPRIAELPLCADVITGSCRTGRVFSADQVRERLGAADTAWWVDGKALNVVARRSNLSVLLCCSFQAPMTQVAGAADLWATSVTAPNLDRAILDILVLPSTESRTAGAWRGPAAPPAAVKATIPADWIQDRVVRSRAMGEDRRLTIYAPPGGSSGHRHPVIYFADGRGLRAYAEIAHALMLAGDLPPLVLVGLWNGPATATKGGQTPDFRMLEYLVGFKGGEARFNAHRRFLFEEVMPLAETEFGAASTPDRRAIAGASNGAAWALQMTASHSDRIGAVIALSPAWTPGVTRLEGAVFGALYLGAGDLEPAFADRARTIAAQASPKARRVKPETRVAGHSQSLWQDLFGEAVVWLFGELTPRAKAGPTAP